MSNRVQPLLTLGVGEQAEVANAMKAWWQDMDQESAYKLIGGQGYGFESLSAFKSIILVVKGHGGVINARDSAV